MKSQTVFDARLAAAGLFATVGGSWIALLLGGTFDGTWLKGGFIAAGLGMLIITLLDRAAGHFFPASEETAVEEEAAALPPRKAKRRRKVQPDPEPAVEPVAAGPRIRVLIGSSCLEALAVALLVSYYSGSPLIALAVGVVAGALAIGVSVLLARKLAPSVVPDETPEAGGEEPTRLRDAA
jgi:hypothetical protein